MHSLGQIPHFPHLIYRPDQVQNQAASAGGTSSLSQMEKTTVFQSQETDLTIATKEGDYVTTSSPNKSTNRSEAIEKPLDPNALVVAQRKMIDTLRDRDLSPDRMARIIEMFFLKFSQVLSENEPHDSVGDGTIDLLKNNLLKEISTRH